MILVYYAIRKYQLFKAINIVFGIILITLLIAACCFYFNTVIIVITPAIMSVLTMIFAYIHRYMIEAKTKEKVESAMGKFMS